ncbi:hypothetical protein LX81_00452 [Palleronia aestuarii]|uniref:Uncharacterized protein n=1 Tax=Palleronia aestuarii TaxID=568105 RepID=A0A2W7QAH7_9RHOB|nr:hypothetical protein [Palleronia aestuarii]PZX18759.1 hypothetical protein LX81_00452 [Palleronia aestuarii]
MTSTLSKLMNPAHKSVARMIGYSLTLGDFDGWQRFAALILARLSDRGRLGLAWAALTALDPEQIRQVTNTVLGGAGTPGVAFTDDHDEAALWANMATDDELRAYAWVTFNRLSPKEQADFLDATRGRDAA